MSKWSIETHTRLIKEVEQAQISLNPLIGLKGINGNKNCISATESGKVINRDSY